MLDSDSSAKAIDEYSFYLFTKQRTYTFRLLSKSVAFWVNTINQTIKTGLLLKNK
jgi:hypothetical protein